MKYKIKIKTNEEYLRIQEIFHTLGGHWSNRQKIENIEKNAIGISLLLENNQLYCGYGYEKLSSFAQSNSEEIDPIVFIKKYGDNINKDELNNRIKNINKNIILYDTEKELNNININIESVASIIYVNSYISGKEDYNMFKRDLSRFLKNENKDPQKFIQIISNFIIEIDENKMKNIIGYNRLNILSSREKYIAPAEVSMLDLILDKAFIEILNHKYNFEIETCETILNKDSFIFSKKKSNDNFFDKIELI